MTFYCKNFAINANRCMLLKAECVPGRPGCVLAGKVKFSEEIEARLTDLETPPVRRRDENGRLIREDSGPDRRRRRAKK